METQSLNQLPCSDQRLSLVWELPPGLRHAFLLRTWSFWLCQIPQKNPKPVLSAPLEEIDTTSTTPHSHPNSQNLLGSHSRSWGPISYVDSGRRPLPSKQNAHMEREIVSLWIHFLLHLSSLLTLENWETSSPRQRKILHFFLLHGLCLHFDQWSI